MLLYLEKVSAEVIKFRIWRGGGYPELSEWALNAMASALVQEGGRSFNTDGRGAGTAIKEADAAGTQTRTENLDKVRTGVCPRA